MADIDKGSIETCSDAARRTIASPGPLGTPCSSSVLFHSFIFRTIMDNKPKAALNDISAALSNVQKKPLALSAVASSEIREEFEKSAIPASDGVQQAIGEAQAVTRRYATTAMHAAGQKVRDVRERCNVAKSTLTQYIDEDPKRAVTYAAVGSAVLTAALIGIFRRR